MSGLKEYYEDWFDDHRLELKDNFIEENEDAFETYCKAQFDAYWDEWHGKSQ